MDWHVERTEVAVRRARAEMHGEGPAGSMRQLQSKHDSRNGRRFHGGFRRLPTGEGYLACVERVPRDDPAKLDGDVGTIPGGLHVRRKLTDGERLLAEHRRGEQFEERIHLHEFESPRPELECYRSRTEVPLPLPVKVRNSPPSTLGTGRGPGSPLAGVR